MKKKDSVESIVKMQREFFLSNRTKEVRFRKMMLRRLRKGIMQHANEVCEALYKDLGKSKAESYMTEILMAYRELNQAIKNVEEWSRPEKVKANLFTPLSKNFIYSEPYGVILVLAPWNYPFNLSIIPLIGAIAAGNCVVLKCSKSSKNTSAVIQKLIREIFPRKYIHCVDADIEHDELIRQKYDYIFFTGSARVGKIVMEAASKNLTPVSLELGGKSPCIVEKSANLHLAACKILWGKLLNAGQTCIAIDYVVVDNKIKDKFIKCLMQEIRRRYSNAEDKANYPKIINQHHYDRLCNLMQSEECVLGGAVNSEERKIAPAVLPDVTFDHEIMKDEIFGPLLPIIGYDSLPEAVDTIKRREKPLACYIFTNKTKIANQLISEISYGGGCVNDTIFHIANDNLPFGGVGMSGMGGYHGKYSFDTFSHKKSVLKRMF